MPHSSWADNPSLVLFWFIQVFLVLPCGFYRLQFTCWLSWPRWTWQRCCLVSPRSWPSSLRSSSVRPCHSPTWWLVRLMVSSEYFDPSCKLTCYLVYRVKYLAKDNPDLLMVLTWWISSSQNQNHMISFRWSWHPAGSAGDCVGWNHNEEV